MALGQLLHLEALFIKSGWLQATCQSFNRENATAIENGRIFKQSPNLYSLDTFVVTPMTKPGKCKAREHDDQRTIADAAGKSSFSELVNPWGLWVHCFVSHFWGHDFSSTVTALELWADENYQKMTSEKFALVFWICLFAVSQHNVAEEVGGTPQQGPFNAALAQAIGGAVMVLDKDIKPFSRIWCLFEISQLKDLQRPFELICTEGSLSKPQSESQAVSLKMLRATCEALWKVSAAKAESSVVADKHQIWAETINKSFRHLVAGWGAQRFFARDLFKQGVSEHIFDDFDRHMKSLLSTTLLQLLIARREYTAAAKCCLYGADVVSEQVQEIHSSFEHDIERKDWLNRVLLETSDASVMRLLLQLSADVETANKYGQTALMLAASRGHEAVAQLLLKHGANVKAARSNGATALMQAAGNGHEAMAQLLLKHRADVKAARSNGATALMWAAESCHEFVAQLLLKHGADVNAARNDGLTALMRAAESGYEDVARLLLKHRADANATRNDGLTPLMRAADGGHEALALLLLEHRADAKGASREGVTGLMLAVEGGHEALVLLLLEHSADVKAESKDGVTALMLATAGGHEAVARLLSEHGADVKGERNNGDAALVFASQGVARLLPEYGPI